MVKIGVNLFLVASCHASESWYLDAGKVWMPAFASMTAYDNLNKLTEVNL